jgi:HEAT repeat protein
MVFGLFSKEKALKKTIERANNPVTQSSDRWMAMEKLRDEGSDEALYALCRRFSFTYNKIIEDQQEKDWVVASLVSLGEPALGPLRRYMKSAKNLGYPLQILGQITSEEKVFEVIDELLEDEEPGYVRDPKRRIDIIEWLGAWSAEPAEVVPRVLPYVEDFDENVRFKSIEALSQKPDPSASETVCRAMVRDEEESQRFQVRCAELLSEQGWTVKSHKDQIANLLPNILNKFSLKGDTLSAN